MPAVFLGIMQARKIIFVIVGSLTFLLGIVVFLLSKPRGAAEFVPQELQISAVYRLGEDEFLLQGIARGDMSLPYMRSFRIAVTEGRVEVNRVGDFVDQFFFIGTSTNGPMFMRESAYIPSLATSHLLFKVFGPEALRVQLHQFDATGTLHAFADPMNIQQNGMPFFCGDRFFVEQTTGGKTMLLDKTTTSDDPTFALHMSEPINDEMICLAPNDVLLPALGSLYRWDMKDKPKREITTFQRTVWGDVGIAVAANVDDQGGRAACKIYAPAGHSVPETIPSCAEAVGLANGVWRWSVANRTFTLDGEATERGVSGTLAAASTSTFMTIDAGVGRLYADTGTEIAKFDLAALEMHLPPMPKQWPPISNLAQ